LKIWTDNAGLSRREAKGERPASGAPALRQQSRTTMIGVPCMSRLGAFVISEAPGFDCGVERFEPFYEQAVHRYGGSRRRFGLPIGKRKPLSPELVNNPISTTVEISQFFHEGRFRILLLRQKPFVPFDQGVECCVLLLDPQENAQERLDECMNE